MPGKQDIDVGINFKPSRRPESAPGRYDVRLSIIFSNNTIPAIELQTELIILQFNGYGAVMGTPLIEAGEMFQLYIHNQGNGPLPLEFSGTDRENALLFDM